MLSCVTYTAEVDVWAVGCILAEMLQREPVLPGKDYIHQLKLIVKFCGTPKLEDVAFVKNQKALRFLSKLNISPPVKLSKEFPQASQEALDLLSNMLVFNPSKRISVEKALRHVYFASFFQEEDLKKAQPFDFDFDIPDEELTQEALADLFYEYVV